MICLGQGERERKARERGFYQGVRYEKKRRRKRKKR